MIANIVDHRYNVFAFAQVYGVVEPSWADNRCDGATQADSNGDHFCEAFGPAPIAEIITWANGYSPQQTTLYLYEKDPFDVTEDEDDTADAVSA